MKAKHLGADRAGTNCSDCCVPGPDIRVFASLGVAGIVVADDEPQH
jgi:hypothetical protein